MALAGAQGRAEEVEFSEKSSQRRQPGQREKKDRHAGRGQRRTRPQTGEVFEIVSSGFASDQRDDPERAHQREGVDGGVEERGSEAIGAARDQAEQSIAGVGHGRVGQESAHVGLHQCDQISQEDRESGQRGQRRNPSRGHGVPGGATGQGSKPDEHDFTEHEKRCDLGTGRDECGGRNGPALIGFGRPEMERGRGYLEGESHERHDEAGGEQRLDGRTAQFLSNRREPGGAGHAIDQAQSEESEGAGRAAEEEILEARFSGADIGFVETGHDIKGQTGEFEPDKDHEKLLAADEQQEADGGEEQHGEVLAAVLQELLPVSEEHGEEGEDEADDLEERGERRDHDHAAEQTGLLRQHGNRDNGAGYSRDRGQGAEPAPACLSSIR